MTGPASSLLLIAFCCTSLSTVFITISSPELSEVSSVVSCYPFLDHLAGPHPASAGQGGPCAADRFTSDIGGLLPIALCGRNSL